MKKLVLLSGHSQRFLDCGYPIKPLVDVGGELVIQLATSNIRESHEVDYSDYMFVIKKSDVVNYNIDECLKSQFKGSVILMVDDHTLGPVYSIQKIQEYIPNDEEVVVAYCDLYINWNFEEFLSFARNNNCDGLIASHTNWHPHRIYNDYFAYMNVCGDDVLEIKEKEHFTDEPINEPASSGIYYFKRGYLLKKYFNELIEKNIKVNDEFYATMPYNLMIRDKLVVKQFLSDNYFCLGTPKDIEIIRGCLYLIRHLDNYNVDISKILEYFKRFYENNRNKK